MRTRSTSASPSCYLGATVVIDDRKSFDPEGLLATLARDAVTFTSLVPTHYIMMLALPEAVKARYDVSAVGKLLISSAPARKDTKLAILEQFRELAAVRALRRRPRPAGSRCCAPRSRSTGSARSAASGPARARSASSIPRAARSPTARSASCSRARPTSSTATGRTPRRRPRRSAATGARSATWRGATPTATSTSSTARAT